MIKRPTWILLVILMLVIVAYFVVKNRASATSTEPTRVGLGNDYLITQADGILQSLRISDNQTRIVQLQRDFNGRWILTLPAPGAADQSLAGAAETQIAALRIVTTLDDQLNLEEAGLDFPSYTIELTFVSGLTHVIEVGALTPTKSGYYISFDAGSLYIVSQSGIDALENLLTAPPFAPTETPSPSIEEMVTPTLEVAAPTP